AQGPGLERLHLARPRPSGARRLAGRERRPDGSDRRAALFPRGLFLPCGAFFRPEEARGSDQGLRGRDHAKCTILQGLPRPRARDAFDESLKPSPKLVVALIGRAQLLLRAAGGREGRSPSEQEAGKTAQGDLDAARGALAERPWVKEKTAAEGLGDPELAEVE